MQSQWPPIYDYEGLLQTIKRLKENGQLIKNFYSSDRERAFLQGDVIKLDAPELLINSNGQAEKLDSSGFWVIMSNSCDLDRSIEQVKYAQLIPIELYQELSEDLLLRAKKYETSRTFYMPPWEDKQLVHGIADFCRPVTVSREALSKLALLVTRLNFHSWLLFHSCIVRFLARADGRHVPTI